MPIVRGTDSDNYDGPVPASHYKLLREQYDIRFNIIGLEAQMPFVGAQKQASAEAGLDVPFGYKFLYWVPSDIVRMEQACRAQLPIAIDCEYETNWSAARVIDRIAEARDLLLREGLYWGIYSGKWWWEPKTGNSPMFKSDRWWHASYPFGSGVLPPSSFMPTAGDGQGTLFNLSSAEMGIGPYAGRTHVQVWQYANTCYGDDLGDWDFDLNAMWIPDTPPGPAPDAPVGSFICGDIRGGLEKRPGQVVLWNEGRAVWAWGDPENETPGKIAKRFGEQWEWLRRWPEASSGFPGHHDAYWDIQEGD